ncbi:hypothetical protein [Flagellimonas myxillae]|uniref:hypothetical protein n=1 Tax=Flagellimonas myxillae TaxID=2942214 RepID=UPI00201EC4E9|nr:hypothetical protein [Muricauda myxillae]MCL6266448.1 hypothetical protein [Muricauda myxillae]
MRKVCFVFTLTVLFTFTCAAQTSYRAALGLGVDAFNEATFFGATGKYFFSDHHVGQADLGFDKGGTAISIFYSYHKAILGSRNQLRWYGGVGPSIILIEDFDNVFALRPHLGLDFKPKGVPFVVNFDWRPALVLSETGDSEAAAFGFGLQFVLK